MKIAILCHSDAKGGAAIVTARLTSALSKHGADAQMIVMNKCSDNLRVEEAPGDFSKKFAFYAERLGIYLHNGLDRKNLFKVSTASHGISLAENPTVKEADAIILSWVNQGMLSLSELKKLIATGKPIIWTMHDMWCFTGICHHAFGCENYVSQCGSCKFLNSNGNDISQKVWAKKREIYETGKIRFVAVSNWLKDCAMMSSLLRDMDVRVIPNAFPIEDYPLVTGTKRNKIIMVAARLDDTVKGLGYAVEALNILAERNPEIAANYQMLFVGEIRDKNAIADLKFPYRHLGTITDQKKLRSLYSQSAVVLSSSLYETLGGTLIEGQACGATPVSFRQGGVPDVIEDGVTGYLAEYKDADSLAAAIALAISDPISPETLHASVSRKFSEDTIAKAFLTLLKS